MAIAKCRECRAEVSDSAKVCPKCGIPNPVKKTSLITKLFLIFLGFGLIGQFINDSSNSKLSSSASAQASTENTIKQALVSGSQWSYLHVADDMGKGTVHYASVLSTNTVEFQFPYSGAQHATLDLRTSPRYGKDIIFSIEKGQLLCQSYDGCIVLVRFDDKPASKYSATGASDHSSETIFLQNYERFMKNMAKAKRLRISTDIYQEGSPVFEFDVSDFDQKKYKDSPA